MNKQAESAWWSTPRIWPLAEDTRRCPSPFPGKKNMAAARSGDRVAVASVSAEDEEAALPAPSHSVDI